MDVRTLCLAALSRGGATGYEIKKMFENGPLAHFQRASFGSIYPALARLVEDGLVLAQEHEQDGRPDKKVHSLTASGRAAFRDALSAAPEPESIKSDLLFMLLFASEMTPDHAAELIDQRIEELHQLADQIEAKLQGAGNADAPSADTDADTDADTSAHANAGLSEACVTPAPGTFFAEPGPKFVGGYGIAIYRAAAAYMADNKEALLSVIREDRATRLDAAE